MKRGEWVTLLVVLILFALLLTGVYHTPCDRNVFCSPYSR
jgi:hypothetical protein